MFVSLLLDTSVLIHGYADPLDKVAISAVSIAELHFGVLVAPDADARADRLRRLAMFEDIFDPLPFDAAAARECGRLHAAVAERGGKPRRRAFDLAIAATARAHGVPLLRRKAADFKLVEDLVEVRSPEKADSATVGWSGRRRSPPERTRFLTCTDTSGLLDLPEEVNSRSTHIATFAELGTSEPVVDALRARSITEPFPVQEMVISDALDGHDLLVQSPTGSGKTLAFGVPLVDIVEPGAWGPQALILAPTRELASQIVDELEGLARARKLNLAAVYGGVGFGPQIARAKKADILVATPGRLEDLIARGAVALDQVRVLVLDEADRMLDMGFRPAVDRIVGLTPDDRQTLFFSATLEGAVGKVAKAYTFKPRSHVNAPKVNVAADIEHRFLRVESQPAKLDALVASLNAEEPGRSLVFVRTKRGADRLVKRLRGEDVEAVAMHGDKSQRQREAALARFERGEVMTLVATDVAARGIDVPDVMRVINYDAPEDRAAYVHRIGRTGRAGRTGTGISFVLADEVGEMRKIARSLGIEFGEGRTEGGAAQPARGEAKRPQGEGRPRRASGKSGNGEKRAHGGSNRSTQFGEKRQSTDGPRRKRRRRRSRKGSTVTAANAGSRD